MRNFISLLLIFTLILSVTAVYAGAADKFTVDEKGAIVGYQGGGDVHIPSEIDGTKVKQITDETFKGKDISTVFVDEGISTIGSGCFEQSTASYIDLPSTTLLVGPNAFASCSELREIVFRQKMLFLGDNALAGTGYLVIHMPCMADETSWLQIFTRVKGDSNYDIELIHDPIEADGEKDAFGANLLVCSDCGQKYSRYPEGISEPFEDVADNAWYYANVATACSAGIINGKSATSFDPDASMTLAEAAKIAACIHVEQTQSDEELIQSGEHWYDVYVNYCYANGIIDENVNFDWNKKTTRAEMAYIFSRCDAKPSYINKLTIDSIPDVDSSTAFANEITNLYNRGIAVGSDEKYTFYPDSDVKRSEAATFIARILFPDMRIKLS